jgi:tetratricopeptide (TPR) repeat protein
VVLLGGMVAVPAWGRVMPEEVEDNEEIIFAVGHPEQRSLRGLSERKFYNLAADQLVRTRQDESLPERVRTEATYYLAELYVKIGDEAGAEGDSKTKLDRYRDAQREYTRYLNEIKGRLTEEEMAEVRYARGLTLEALAMDRGAAYELVVEKEEKTAYKADAVEWFGQAAEDFDYSAKIFKARRDHWEEHSKTVKEREKYWWFRDQAAGAMSHRSWTYYHYAKLFDDPEEKEKREKLLRTALEEFLKLAKDYSLFNLGLEAQRGAGLCYENLGEYEKAVERFNNVLEARRDKFTKQLLRLAHYNLATTFNAMGGTENAEKARVEVSLLLTDLDREPGGLEGRMRDLRMAAMLEEAKALLTLAEQARAKWVAFERAGKKLEAKRNERACRTFFMQARDTVQDVADDRESPWRRNGEQLLADLQERSKQILGEELKRRETIHTFMSRAYQSMADADKALGEQKLNEAYKAIVSARRGFEDAIRAGNPRLYGRTLIPEAYYKIAEIYYIMPKYIPAEEKDRNIHYYYEAGTVFGELAFEYPEADKDLAAQSAYASQQFFGALFNQRRKAGVVTNDDAQRYSRALSLFAQRFPEHPAARRAKFQSAELYRTSGDYVRAAETYATLKIEDPGFLEGMYLSGFCYWMEALRRFEQAGATSTAGAKEAAEKAVGRYEAYLTWFAENRNRVGTQMLWQANRSAARTRLSLGKLYIHQMVREPDKALAALADVESENMALDKDLVKRLGVKEEKPSWADQMLPEVLFVEISAYRLKDDLPAAEAKVREIFKRYGPHPHSVTAARLLGLAYYEKRTELEKTKPEAKDQIAFYTQKYAEWFGESLKYDPDQSLDAYVELAKGLYQLKQYDEATRWIEQGRKRFGDKINEAERQRLVAMLEQIALQQKNWKGVVEWAGWLLKQPQNENAIDYWRDLAEAYEQLGYWDYALPCWRRVKYIAENAEGEQYKDEQDEAVVRLARVYCKKKKPDPKRAFNIVMWAIHSDLNMLRRQAIRQSVIELFEKQLPDKMGELKPLLDRTQE